jgi:hypothetical protein
MEMHVEEYEGGQVTWLLLSHIGLPALFGLAFVVFSMLPTRGPLTWHMAIEIGLDLAILSIGAIGALFGNPILVGAYGGEHAVLLALAVLGVNFVLSGILLFMKRHALDHEIGREIGTAALIIGALTVIVVGGVVSWAHNSSAQKAMVSHVRSSQIR